MEAILVIAVLISVALLSGNRGFWSIIRGASCLVSLNSANRKTLFAFEAAKDSLEATDHLPIEFADLLVPLHCLSKPTILLGQPGTGKTSLITSVLQSITKLFERHPGRTRILILDSKLDSLEKLNSILPPDIPVHVLNPLDVRFEALDWGGIFRTRGEIIQLSEMICPKISGDSSPYFRNWARALVAGTVYVLQIFAKKAERKWRLLDLIKILISKKTLRHVCYQTAETKSLFQTSLGTKADSSADIFSTLRSVIAPFIEIALTEARAKTAFNISDFLAKDGVVVLGIPPKSSGLAKPLFSVFIRRLVEESLVNPNRHKDDRLFLVLDEIAQLESSLVEPLNNAAALGRSSNIFIISATQSIEVLEQSFGEKATAAFLSCAENLVGFRSSPKTADYLSKSFGNQEGLIKTTSHSRGPNGNSTTESFSFHTRPVVMAEEFMDLPLANPSRDRMEFYFRNPFLGSVFVTSKFMAKVLLPADGTYPNFLQSKMIASKNDLKINGSDVLRFGLPKLEDK